MAQMTKTIPPGSPNGGWTQLAAPASAAAKLSIYPVDGPIWVKPTASAASPTDRDGAILVKPEHAIIDRSLTELFPGFTAPTHLYALPYRGGGDCLVTVSYA